ncbi:MAG: beta strand repeat-containing protein, partial [Syntrophobacteraceae bacterium]
MPPSGGSVSGLGNVGSLLIDNTSTSGGSRVIDQAPLYNYYQGYYGSISIGNPNLSSSAASTMSVAGFTDLDGNPGNTWEGYLSVTSGAGTAEFDTGGNAITTIDSNSGITLDGPQAYVNLKYGDSNNSALNTLATNNGSLTLQNGASLNDTATLTNTGNITIGNSDQLSGVTSSMSVAGLASSTWDGALTVTSGAGRAEFITGATGISTIDTGSSVTLSGSQAFVDLASSTGTNSALGTLATNNGTLDLENGAQITTGGGLTNSGYISVDADNYYYGSNTGGSGLTVGGPLTNYGLNSYGYNSYGSISVGNSGLQSGQTSTMSVGGLADSNGTATSTWEGNLNVTSGQGKAAFVTGGAAIDTIDTSSGITVNGSSAYVELASGDNSNSALTTLATNNGSLTLQNGASVSTTNGLTSSGSVYVDSSNLAVGGTLANSGSLDLENGASTAIANGLT